MTNPIFSVPTTTRLRRHEQKSHVVGEDALVIQGYSWTVCSEPIEERSHEASQLQRTLAAAPGNQFPCRQPHLLVVVDLSGYLEGLDFCKLSLPHRVRTTGFVQTGFEAFSLFIVRTRQQTVQNSGERYEEMGTRATPRRTMNFTILPSCRCNLPPIWWLRAILDLSSVPSSPVLKAAYHEVTVAKH